MRIGQPAPDLLGTADIETKGRSQGFFRTGGDTRVAEDAFGGKHPLTLLHVCRNVDIHRADLGADTAIVAGLGIARDLERGESGGQFERHHNRTGVLAKCPVVFEGEGQNKGHRIVEQVAAGQPEYNLPAVVLGLIRKDDKEQQDQAKAGEEVGVS